ncbi:PD40 domain-containing protein [Solitalea koreensis]|uniref:WD40-like Beta Propeller Repeat n=1 Tax=Solitalea koreensis TaxID=543615 RepID=A0A521BF36_9SPHI|nr:PD40 domain-containing protein [Solitalea koreensis]SMO45692.1 WD40-like Beta Propeller Repeat [Solitalea koreensis]
MHLSPYRKLFLIVITVVISTQTSYAQYFGRNKVQYEKFKFTILKTPHFDIYNYQTNDTVMRKFADLAERWYGRHKSVLLHSLESKNPIMIYNNHSDFSQTSLSEENIGVGTGGVTEGYRNRIFMPFFESYAQTDHVLGHEMVHAFQYDILKSDDSLSLNNIRNLPLWMVEGMAEYMSLGRKDSHTAMWMRDAVVNKDIPTLKDLSTTNKYFPYRYGQAFWAFVAGVWGDNIIKPLYLNTAKFGYQMAVDSTLGYEEKVLSNMWKTRTMENYAPFMKDTIALVGNRIIRKEDAGDMNISPVLSPDGKYITFLSERNLFSIDLFLAEVSTGRIIRKLSSATEKLHVDDYNYIEDAGTWSPDGKSYAYIVSEKGKSNLVIVDINTGANKQQIIIKGLPYFSNPTWSPDGNTILVTGLKDGHSDLFLYNLQTKKVRQLTNDYYSEIQGAWSKDGKKIVFVSDRGNDTDLPKLKFGSFKICILDLASGRIDVKDFFPGANNLNPQFSADSKRIFFLSNADGMRNLYEFTIETGEINKLTKYFTGISGITEYAPALSVNGPNDEIAYCLFKKGDYNLYKAQAKDFPRFNVDPEKVDFTASLLPPFDLPQESLLTKNLSNFSQFNKDTSYIKTPYRPKFSLVNVSSTGGVGVGYSQYGTGLAGGVGFQFGDILDRNQLFAVAQINGEIYDFGGQVQYINRAGRVNYGFGVSHIPYFSANQFVSVDTIHQGSNVIETDSYNYDKIRTFVNQFAFYTYYPVSQTLRYEANLTLSRYSYRVDRISDNYVYVNGQAYDYYQSKGKVDAEQTYGVRPFSLATMELAYVGDNSQFGVTSPMKGQRFRLEGGRTFGDYNVYSLYGDYRKYFYHKPWSIALRGIYYGRYGDKQDLNRLYPLFIGYDQFVRGYNQNSLYDNPGTSPDDLTVDQLIGDHMAVANVEFRLPLTGPEKLAQVKSGFLFSDLGVFFDSGMAWKQGAPVELSWKTKQGVYSPIFSTGITLRVNLFGFAILEPYYAFPFQRGNAKPTFGLFLSGGGW